MYKQVKRSKATYIVPAIFIFVTATLLYGYNFYVSDKRIKEYIQNPEGFVRTYNHTCYAKALIDAPKNLYHEFPQSLTDDQPICQQFNNCSCCKSSYKQYAKGILKKIDKGAIQLDKGQPKTQQLGRNIQDCKASMDIVLCRACDLEVGLGSDKPICSSLCQQWFSACQNLLISIDHSNNIQICGQQEGMEKSALLCFRVKDTYQSSQEFCQAYGFPVQAKDNENCYDGQNKLNSFQDNSLCQSAQQSKTQYGKDLKVIKSRVFLVELQKYPLLVIIMVIVYGFMLIYNLFTKLFNREEVITVDHRNMKRKLRDISQGQQYSSARDFMEKSK